VCVVGQEGQISKVKRKLAVQSPPGTRCHFRFAWRKRRDLHCYSIASRRWLAILPVAVGEHRMWV